ncbi:MAG: type II secretion system F family protein [Micrococcales bacterium]
MPNNSLENRLFPKEQPKFRPVRVKRPKAFDPMLLELPQILDWLALATANGLSIYQALWQVSTQANGQVAKQLAKVCKGLEYGESLESALTQMRDSSGSASVQEFCNRLILTMQRGTPVAAQLRALAKSSRAQLRNQLLARAGANEIKLLLPLVFMILPITVWFAVFPSLQLLQLGI